MTKYVLKDTTVKPPINFVPNSGQKHSHTFKSLARRFDTIEEAWAAASENETPVMAED